MYTYLGELHDSTNRASARYLEVNSSGMQNNNGKAFTLLRPKGRVDYHILYLVAGRCEAELRGRAETLLPGNFVFYPPNEPQRYCFSENVDTVSYWVHFSGTAVEEALRGTGFERGGIFHTAQNPAAESLFHRLITRRSPGFMLSDVGANAVLLSLVAELSAAASGGLSARAPDRLSPVLQQINLHMEEKLDPRALAAMCGLSVSRFLHVFKASVGSTPREYQLAVRMDKAGELLRDSDLSVAEIADFVGFGNPLYFSTAFKQYAGLPPREFRENAR